MNPTERDPAGFRRVLYSSMLGTAIEWYDFFLYGMAAALVFNQLFFPQLDPVTGTLASFASYAVGFFARPHLTYVRLNVRVCHDLDSRHASSRAALPTR